MSLVFRIHGVFGYRDFLSITKNNKRQQTMKQNWLTHKLKVFFVCVFLKRRPIFIGLTKESEAHPSQVNGQSYQIFTGPKSAFAIILKYSFKLKTAIAMEDVI